jgi:hypothetical protein
MDSSAIFRSVIQLSKVPVLICIMSRSLCSSEITEAQATELILAMPEIVALKAPRKCLTVTRSDWPDARVYQFAVYLWCGRPKKVEGSAKVAMAFVVKETGVIYAVAPFAGPIVDSKDLQRLRARLLKESRSTRK